jgi:hypothetical protein
LSLGFINFLHSVLGLCEEAELEAQMFNLALSPFFLENSSLPCTGICYRRYQIIPDSKSPLCAGVIPIIGTGCPKTPASDR